MCMTIVAQVILVPGLYNLGRALRGPGRTHWQQFERESSLAMSYSICFSYIFLLTLHVSNFRISNKKGADNFYCFSFLLKTLD